MAVQHIVLDRVGLRLRQHAIHELGQVVIDQVLVVGMLRAGGNVDHARPRPQFVADARRVGVLRAGVDINAVAAAGQLTRQVAHVDVHPARLFAAQRRQGASVDAQHGDVEEITHLTATGRGR